MTTIAAYGYYGPGEESQGNVGILCLWAGFGMAMTALIFAMGLGAQFASTLAMAG
ncbi:MAG: hypothetical protein QOG74_1625 [Alphaproteobacteria bacterium]|jgi:hypothetical protein|nr:hypothetical protein [Alphaproteobacteria bacterium]